MTPMLAALAKWGPVWFLVFALLGIIPWIPSPLTRLQDQVQAIGATVAKHDQAVEDGNRVHRLICRGVWRGQTDVQAECDK